MSVHPALVEGYRAAERWAFDSAFPFWSEHGVDWSGWGFHERFAQTGELIPALPRRTRVVARQIFSFMAAGRMGWRGDWRAVVDHGARALLEICIRDDGLVHSTCDDAGRPIASDFDFYDHAFALFALAQLARLDTWNARATVAALRMLDSMEAGFRHPVAGFVEDDCQGLPLRANPHMHMLEACLAQASVSGASPRWRLIADEIVALALDKFIDAETGGLREFFDWNWGAMPDESGRLIEPGHQFEWSWLLRWWNDHVQNARVEAAAARLFAIGADHGISAQGIAIDELWDDFTPRTPSARNWPQTEWLKASLAAAEHADTAAARALHERQAFSALAALTRYFETPVRGLWHDRLDGVAKPLEAPAPASSLYHIICALEYCQAYIGRGVSA